MIFISAKNFNTDNYPMVKDNNNLNHGLFVYLNLGGDE